MFPAISNYTGRSVWSNAYNYAQIMAVPQIAAKRLFILPPLDTVLNITNNIKWYEFVLRMRIEMTPISLTALRSQLFKIVDRVIETGMPVEIERKGHKLKIVLDEKKSKLINLKRRNCIVGDPDELIDLKVGEWNEEANL
jgi:hypothetical protein